jgi:hypothetical protein
MATEQELERLVVKLTGDGSEFKKMIQSAQSQVQSFVATTVAALSSFGAMSFLKSAFADFSRAEEGMIRLNAAVRAGGHDVESTVAEYKSFAASIAEATTTTKGSTLALLQQAEAFGASGAAAQRAVQHAIALGKGNQDAAGAMLRITSAMAQGDIHSAMMFKRAIPELRRFKTEAEFVAGYQKLLQSGWEATTEIAKTTGAQLEKLDNSLQGLKKEFGRIVEEAIRPFIPYLKAAVDFIKSMDDQTKKLIVTAAAITAGILLIGPAIATVKLLLAPVLALFGPLAVAIAAAAAAIYLFANYTKTGAEATAWFAKQWEGLKAQVGPSIEAIKQAIKAGDLKLAWEILWTEIQIVFIETTAKLIEGWVGVTFKFRTAWAEMAANIKSTWTSSLTDIAIAYNFMLFKLGLQSKETAAKIHHELLREKGADLNAIQEEKQQRIDGAVEGAKGQIQAVNDYLAELKKRSAEAIELAKTYDFFNQEEAKKLDLDFASPQGKDKRTGEKQDAAARGGAEAASRIAAYRDQQGQDPNAGMIKAQKDQQKVMEQIRDKLIQMHDQRLRNNLPRGIGDEAGFTVVQGAGLRE